MGRQMTSAMKYGLDTRLILISVVEGKNRTANARSGTALGQRICVLLSALPAGGHPAKSADDADECPTMVARVTFGGTLLVAAGPAYHRIPFAKQLAHGEVFCLVRVRKKRNRVRVTRESMLGPAFHNAFCRLQPGW